MASSLGEVSKLFWVNFALADLSSTEGRFDDAHAHPERAESHAVNNTYFLACASQLWAVLWDKQDMFGSEALRALGIFEKLGATNDAEETRKLLGQIDRNAIDSDDDGEHPKTMLLVMCVNSSYLDWVTESG